MLNTFRARANCEQETKFVQTRILLTERTVAELCHLFGQYARKAARLRDKGDDLAKVAIAHTEAENINKTLCTGLENFADCMSMLGSYGDARVQSIDAKVIKEFSRYEEICKHAKDDVKQLYGAREKEIMRQRQLERVQERHPRNRQQIVQAETELVKASTEFARTLSNLEEKSVDFEKQKLHDMKSILLDFVSIEMGYHAKALEILTAAFKNISSIDEDSDLEGFHKVSKMVERDFKKSLQMQSEQIKRVRSRSLFRTTNSLGSLGAIFTTNRAKSATPGIPKAKRGISKSAETLDSLKRSITESEDSSSTESEDEEKPTGTIRKHRR